MAGPSSSRAITVINVLIVVSLLLAAGVVAAVVLTAVQAGPTLSIGSASATTTAGATQIQVPITLTNKGPLSVSDISVKTNVTDSSDDQLMTGTLGPLTVAPGATESLNVQLSLEPNLPAAVLQKLAMTAQNLTVAAVVSTSIPPFVKLSAAVSANLAWGAPVTDLKVGTPSFSPLNATAVTATVPVSFQNQNDYLTISGTGNIAVIDSTGKQVGGGTLQVNAPPNSSFNQTANLVVGIPSTQIQSLLLNDTTLDYTAQLSGTFNSFTFSTSQPISVAWGAPVKGLSIGSLTATVYNATYARFSAPISFRDNSAFLGISGTMSGSVTDSSHSVVGSIAPLSVSVNPGQPFSSTITGFIQLASASQSSLTLNLTFQTPYGPVSEQVVVNA